MKNDYLKISNDWKELLKDEFNKDYFLKLSKSLEILYKESKIYPPPEDIFKALNLSSYEDTKVLILGQDPYYNEGEANGLAFSVNDGIKIPPSLRNIYKELQYDLNISMASTGNLTSWAKQGVLLLNATLTVEEKKPNIHKDLGWSKLTDKIISILNEREKPCVFILWGNFARKKKILINNSRHLILESAHPSPLSARRGFFKSRPFSKTNKFLKSNNLKEIDWKIED